MDRLIREALNLKCTGTTSTEKMTRPEANPGNLFYTTLGKGYINLKNNAVNSTIQPLTFLTPKYSRISLTYVPVASIQATALRSLSLFLCLSPPRHPPSDWLRLFFEPNLFPYKYPNIRNPRHTSYLLAYEDGTHSVLKNIGI
jgi:hypothetical protein